MYFFHRAPYTQSVLYPYITLTFRHGWSTETNRFITSDVGRYSYIFPTKNQRFKTLKVDFFATQIDGGTNLTVSINQSHSVEYFLQCRNWFLPNPEFVSILVTKGVRSPFPCSGEVHHSPLPPREPPNPPDLIPSPSPNKKTARFAHRNKSFFAVY